MRWAALVALRQTQLDVLYFSVITVVIFFFFAQHFIVRISLLVHAYFRVTVAQRLALV